MSPRREPGAGLSAWWLMVLLAGLAGLSLLSLLVGVSEVSLATLLWPDEDSMGIRILVVSRVPRTLALILVGVSMAVAGCIMQMLSRNRFVEPSTAGTVESAVLGLLAVALVAPGLAPLGKMLVAALFALGGTALFLTILQRVPLRSALLVPLIGLVLGGVINAIATFLAYRHDLLQSLHAWTTGDFSAVLRGRYEMLWLALALAVGAYVAADRFTVLGLGEDFATNAGLRHGRLVALGLGIVALISAAAVVTVGVVPFIGLIVPHVVALFMGDNLRRSLPWIAGLGALLVLACDIAGRLVLFPYEVPIGTVMGIVGSALFLGLLLRNRARVA